MPAKKAAKKTSKKAAKKAGAKKASKKAAGFPPPPIPLACLKAAFAQYMSCLQKGVDPALCTKRYMKNLADCFKR
ncbi:MAG: hypothetical protein JWM21_154 [Acidobacteria bacterium]|jgi:hypothetical protein|nr:hypothetical protein [Acidobacteriota bacterium]